MEESSDRVVNRRRGLVSLFISNLSLDSSRVELEAMFWRAGKIMNTFIPVDRKTGRKRGIAFVRFKSRQEALRAISMAHGRSWGGRKISVTFARRQVPAFPQAPNDLSQPPAALRTPALVSIVEDARRAPTWKHLPSLAHQPLQNSCRVDRG